VRSLARKDCENGGAIFALREGLVFATPRWRLCDRRADETAVNFESGHSAASEHGRNRMGVSIVPEMAFEKIRVLPLPCASRRRRSDADVGVASVGLLEGAVKPPCICFLGATCDQPAERPGASGTGSRKNPS